MMLRKYATALSAANRALIILMSLCVLSTYSLIARANVQQVVYGPTVSASIKLGQKRQIARMGAVIPLLQNPNEIFYGSIIGMMDAQKSSEGNIGLGWRSRVNPESIFGLYGFMDFRRTPNKNIVSQLTLGTEWLGEYFEARANLYLPLNDTFHSTTTRNFVSNYNNLANVTTFEFTARRVDEVAMMGCDFEVGGTLSAFDKLSAYSAYYVFSHPRVRAIHGLRVRANLSLTDWCAFETEVNYDTIRGFMPYAGITLSWNNSKKGNKSLSRLEKKMTQLPVRDIDIVTDKADAVVNMNRIRKNGYVPLINTAMHVRNVQGNNLFNSVAEYNLNQTAPNASDIAFIRDDRINFGFVSQAATHAELDRIGFRYLNERKIQANSALERSVFGNLFFINRARMGAAAIHLHVHAEPIRRARQQRLDREARARQAQRARQQGVAAGRAARQQQRLNALLGRNPGPVHGVPQAAREVAVVANPGQAQNVGQRRAEREAEDAQEDAQNFINNRQNTKIADISIRQSNDRLEERYSLRAAIDGHQHYQRRGLRVAGAIFEGRRASYYNHIQRLVVNAPILHRTADFADGNPRKHDARYNDELASELAQFALDRIADGRAGHAYNNIRTDVSLALVFTAIMDENHIAVADRGDHLRNLRKALVETTREYNRNHDRCRILVPQPGDQPDRVYFDDRVETEAHQTACAHGTHNKIIETLDNVDGNGHPDVFVNRDAGWAVSARAQELALPFFENYERENPAAAALVREARAVDFRLMTDMQENAEEAYHVALVNHLRPLLTEEFVENLHVTADWLNDNIRPTAEALDLTL